VTTSDDSQGIEPDELAMLFPEEPPPLTPGAARALLRMLLAEHRKTEEDA
jgi:hypothetical protein